MTAPQVGDAVVSKANGLVDYVIEFVEGMNPDGTWNVTVAEGGARVAWSRKHAGWVLR